MKRITLIFLTLYTLLFFTRGVCDTVTLKNGTRLEGVMEGLKKALVSFEITGVDPVSFDWSDVDALSTDQIVYVELADGRNVSGKIKMTSSDDANIEVCLPPDRLPVASIDISKDQFKTIQITPFQTSYNKWSGKVALGGAYFTGNTRKRGINLLLNAQMDNYHYDKIENVLEFDGWLNYLNTNGRIVENDGGEQIQFIHHWTPRLHWYAAEFLDYDKPAALRLRTDVRSGVGFTFFDYECFKVTLRNGIGRTDSYYLATPNFHRGFFAYIPALLVWAKINPLYFSSESMVEFSLQSNDRIATSINRLFLPMTKSYLLELRYVILYNSNPPRKIKTLDTRATINLVYSF